MVDREKSFYLVDLAILPEAIKKTVEVKELLKEGHCSAVNEAVKKVKISRSAYYKYKDHVLPGWEVQRERIVMVMILMATELPLMGRVTKKMLFGKNEILTLQRNVPAKRTVSVTVAVKSSEPKSTWDDFTVSLSRMKGIKSVYWIEQGVM